MTAPDRVAVIGMGAVGTLLAGHLAAAGRPILTCGRAPIASITLTTDDGSHTYPVEWTDDPDDLAGIGWALLATKVHDTAATAGWLAALGGAGRLIAAQNGVDHRRRLAPLTRAAVVPMLVYVNAERTGPGQVRARATGRGVVVPDDPTGLEVAALFAPTDLAVEAVVDFRTAAWEKLLGNVTANPLTALTGRRVEVLREPAVARLAGELLDETVAVATAEGADLADGAAVRMLDWLQALPPDAGTSMLHDRLAGRPLEHDGLLGPVVRGGERHGIPTPAGRAALTLLSALPTSTAAPSPSAARPDRRRRRARRR